MVARLDYASFFKPLYTARDTSCSFSSGNVRVLVRGSHTDYRLICR